MQKALIITTLLAVSTTTFAKGGFQDNKHPEHGKPHSQQGFFDESLAAKTVAAALKAEDNTFVILQGNIVKQLDKNEFIFKDASGEVEIEVSKRAWNGATVTPQDTIEIRGKVDKEWNNTEIDVKQVIKK